jgi:hypothetical protein
MKLKSEFHSFKWLIVQTFVHYITHHNYYFYLKYIAMW